MKPIVRTTGILLASAILIPAAAILLSAIPAQAQGLNNSAWAPKNGANRASVAALIRQVEEGDEGSSGGYAAIGMGGGVTQLICGSNSGEGAGASSNAQANSSCIILNNSKGDLNIDQASEGDQTADTSNTVTTSVDETINAAGGAEEVLDALSGN